jgi:hypothetical protein
MEMKVLNDEIKHLAKDLKKCREVKRKLIRKCGYCGMVLEGRPLTAVYCNSDCRIKAFIDRKRILRVKIKQELRQQPQQKVCPECYKKFNFQRKSAIYCSESCRSAAYRSRKENRYVEA